MSFKAETYASGVIPTRSDTRRILLVKQLTAINAGGGGGGGSGAPDSINYAGPPIVNPPALQNIVVDSNGQQWMYWGGAWN